MRKHLELDQFSGPLDLLLQLIEGKELDITSVALAEVTEQFLEYLEEVEERLPEELADFLVVATRLLLLKSQALMPYLQTEEDDDPNELAAQLRMYKRYVDAMHAVDEMLAQKRVLFPRKPLKVQQTVEFKPPADVTGEELEDLFREVLTGLEPVVRIPKAAMQKVVTLREKFDQIRGLLRKSEELGFDDLLADAQDRGEVVVTFLALLEMVKKQEVSVQQDNPFDTLSIKKL